MASINPTPSADTPIAIKLALNNGENRRFKLVLRDLGANTFPDKLRSLLNVPSTQDIHLERFSDSAGLYVPLDSNNPAVYKQLYRAAKAKLKLRIKATITDVATPETGAASVPNRLPAHCYTPPKNESTPSLGSAPTDAQLMKEFAALNGSSGVKLSASGQTPHTKSQRFKLPYDPCLSPSHTAATANGSLLDTANPIIKDASSKEQSMLDDFQRQLMLLEQQNKKRLLMARQPAVEDDQLQSKLLEQQNQKALHKARQEQKCAAEAPVPQSFTACEDPIAELGDKSVDSVKKPAVDAKLSIVAGSFTICCNRCQANIPDAHWHCSSCNAGDFDLCGACIEKGVLCDSEDHWLIKRSIKSGKIVNSTTETIPPKTKKIEPKCEIPAVSATHATPKIVGAALEDVPLYRTCNSCVEAFVEANFNMGIIRVMRLDLLVHRLGWTAWPLAFVPQVAASATSLFAMACMKSARTSHPGHRFISLNEPIPFTCHRGPVHYNINCDGPLCKDVRTFISGDRYKCAICDDIDFCAKCEALPTNRHNRTHPLIKFKSPIRNVSVTTLGEKENGEHMWTMGDQLPQFTSKATETVPAAPSANAATQVQTVAEIKPIDASNIESKEAVAKAVLSQELQAHFIRDAVADGSVLPPSKQFWQVWTLRNPGPHAWPPGCSVRFVGGDTMFNVDPNHPLSVTNITKATQSNIIDRVVQVGEEVDFTVVMRTPDREGKAISYWRLKDADGLPFGHKLWCDIVVQSGKKDETESAAQPDVSTAVKPTQADVVLDAVAEKQQVEDAASATQSQMIFPTLDKESPVSSTHEETAAVAPSASSTASVSSAVTANEEKELLEEVENLSLADHDDVAITDDGFLTDEEEFEMLEASEDDFAEAVNGKVRK
ncbi:MAG: hypothetical protein Q9182_002398 [Xanthomendoza sp. 2 TL-2023]